MCEDGQGVEHGHGAGRLSRRQVLLGMVALSTLAACRYEPTAAATARRGSVTVNGRTAYALAMHLHASTSEGVGSMRAQLAQAASNGFDVAWFSEHDWRRRRLLFRTEYHFVEDSSYGGIWKLPRMDGVGSLTSTSGGALVGTPTSPNDTAPSKASLRLRATGTGDDPATVRYHVDAAESSRRNYSARITGRTISLDVLPTQSGPDGWGEVRFMLSRQLASGARPAGQISMTYRLRPDVVTRTVRSQGTEGIVDLPVTPNNWQTITIDLTSDVHAVWSDIDPRDNALHDIQFAATSRNRVATEVYFGFLRFAEEPSYSALGVEQELLDAYAADAPGVAAFVGTEISLDRHLNQYGGTQAPYDYGAVTDLFHRFGDVRPSVVQFIHANGGLASINHPFKPGDASAAAGPRAVALDLLAGRAAGADILEVGYADKGINGTLANHLAVWDTLSRNAVVVTGTGVSDDHTGQHWERQPNRFYTGTWATEKSEAALLDALAHGRSYVGFLGGFSGTIDMAADAAPMGSVVVDAGRSRNLHIGVTGLPDGGAVQVVRGDVDYAGTARPTPNTKVTRTLGASDLDSSSELTVDTSDECFYRLQVIDRSGHIVAFGQPIWLLHGAPDAGVPAARRA